MVSSFFDARRRPRRVPLERAGDDACRQKVRKKMEILHRGVMFRVSHVLQLFLLRVQLSRQLLQVRRRDDAVIGDERLDDEEAPFIVSSLLLLPVFVIDKLSNGV